GVTAAASAALLGRLGRPAALLAVAPSPAGRLSRLGRLALPGPGRRGGRLRVTVCLRAGVLQPGGALGLFQAERVLGGFSCLLLRDRLLPCSAARAAGLCSLLLPAAPAGAV